MKTYIYKILLFTFIFLLVNVFTLLLIQKFDNNFSKVIEIKNFKEKSFKCIVLGNSLTLDGIDTEYLSNNGLSSYNFALAGSTLKSNYIMLTSYLKENTKPKVVLLGLGSSLKNYSSSKSVESVHPIVDYCYGDNKLTFDILPMIKFKWLVTENLKKLVSKDHRESKVVLGQLKTKRKVPDKTNYNNILKYKISFDDYKGAKYLFEIDSVCKANNVDLILIEMPGFKKTQNDIPIGPHILKDSMHTITLYNLNNRVLCQELFDSNNDWLGNSHLNEYGAKKLTIYTFEEFLKDSI